MSVDRQTTICGAPTRRGTPCKHAPTPGSNPPRCRWHSRATHSPGGRARCKARTKQRRPCRMWALPGQKYCRIHKPRRPHDQRCTARTASGKPCRNLVVSGSRPPRCVFHGPRRRRPQRCRARTKQGRPCRSFATRHSIARGRPRCVKHAPTFITPAQGQPPGRRRCQARTKAGERCLNWAMRHSKARDGRWLCIYHAAGKQALHAGPQSRVRRGRRCTARTQSGDRCRHWALSDGSWPGDKPLCAFHAGRHFNYPVLHGYYSARPQFTPQQRAAILHAAKSGEPLAAEILIVRFNLQRLLQYLKRDDLSPWRRDAAFRSALKAINAVRRLMLARHNLARIRWAPTSGGNAGKQLDALLQEEEE